MDGHTVVPCRYPLVEEAVREVIRLRAHDLHFREHVDARCHLVDRGHLHDPYPVRHLDEPETDPTIQGVGVLFAGLRTDHDARLLDQSRHRARVKIDGTEATLDRYLARSLRHRDVRVRHEADAIPRYLYRLLLDGLREVYQRLGRLDHGRQVVVVEVQCPGHPVLFHGTGETTDGGEILRLYSGLLPRRLADADRHREHRLVRRREIECVRLTIFEDNGQGWMKGE